jgi:phospholipid-binding lipoprotein MlaA
MAQAERSSRRGLATFLALLVALSGTGAPIAALADEVVETDDASTGHAYDDYDDLYFDEEPEEEDDNDPIEGFNRGVFWINDGVDRNVLEPVATGFDYVVPDFAQRALRDAFDNLRFPIVFFNNLFQGKPARAGSDFARFVVNTTVGIGGFMDPASEIGLTRSNEDFGQTMGVWGVPPGPYLMLPFFGPSNVRDTGGLVVDTAFRAIGFFIPFVASVVMTGVDTLNRRSMIREEIQAERRAALDWYAAVRSAYSQYRENLVQDARQRTDSKDDEFRDYYPAFQGDVHGSQDDAGSPADDAGS